MPEFSASVTFFFRSLIPLCSKWCRSVEEARRATVCPGDPIVWRPEGCFTKFSAHPRLNRTMQRTEVFWKRQSSLSGKDSLEGKEKKSRFSSVLLILQDSLFYLLPVCKYIHNGLWLLHCPAHSLFSSLPASAPLVEMLTFDSIR